MSNKIRIKLQSYDQQLLDKSVNKIIKAVQSTGVVVSGPIPLPTKKSIYTVLRGPTIDKKARDQFEQRNHKRLLDLHSTTPKTIDNLMKTEISSAIKVNIKV
ncbi:MAG: 30S ribosomal protein S10 [Bacteroidota bacterium]